MEITTCRYCHKLVYVGFLEHNRFLFDDPRLEHPHTKTRCQQNQKDINIENSASKIQEQIFQLREEVLRIKEKIGLD